MFGLIGKITAQPGQRDALINILLEGTGQMPGCLNYVVARDATRADVLWVHEAWEDEASHQASLTLPAVRDAITRGRPMIASFESVARTEPMGGWGLMHGR